MPFKKKKNEELDDLVKWSKEESKSDKGKASVAILFMAITMGFIVLSIMKVIPVSFIILDLMVNYAVIKVLTKDMDEVINLLKEYEEVKRENEKHAVEYLNKYLKIDEYRNLVLR